jgi:hypothetical protein
MFPQVRGDFAELFEGGFEVFDDFLSENVGIEEIVGFFKAFDNCGGAHSSTLLFEMLLKSSANADDRETHDFFGFLVIPNHYAFSHIQSDGRPRLTKANIESVCLSIIFPI